MLITEWESREYEIKAACILVELSKKLWKSLCSMLYPPEDVQQDPCTIGPTCLIAQHLLTVVFCKYAI